MKKCITGVGLLLASLILFGCQKTVTETSLDKLPETQTKSVLFSKIGSHQFKPGFTSGNVKVYAARLSNAKVSELFSDAYYVTSGSIKTDGTIDPEPNTMIKEAIGNDFVIGDDFVVGYRLVDGDKILRSKVVRYRVIADNKVSVYNR